MPGTSHLGFAAIIGAAVGFFSGLFGKGGSAVTTPALRVLLDVPRMSALASPLPATLPITISASFAYRDQHLIDWRIAGFTALAGIPATVIGSLLTERVGGHTLMLMTGVFVLLLGVSFLRGTTNYSSVNPGLNTDAPPTASMWKICVVGLGVGLLSGLLANSGGILFAPLFVRVLHVPIRRALPTSLIASCALAVPGTVTHSYLGHIDWALAAALSCGALPASYLGARLAIALKTETLEKAFGVFLILFGLYDVLWTELHHLWRP